VAVLNNILYWIATGLLVPVVIGLLLMLGRALLVAGAAYALYLDRAKFQAKLGIRLKAISPEALPSILSDTGDRDHRRPNVIALEGLIASHASTAHREKIIADFEVAADAELGQARTLARVGPMLGLMGTLIPMGPALIGLAAGDLKTLAENMQVAFTTTVVGLLIGGIGFTVYQIKQRWFHEELSQVEFVAALLSEKWEK